MDTRIGKQLTQAREALGLIVEDVAHRTRIPASVVRQLESEDFTQFPNNVYAKSFLRLYSRHLGVDPANYIAANDGRLQKRENDVSFLDGIALSSEFQPDSGKPTSAGAAAVAAVESSRAESAPSKVSNGIMTVLLLLVVGVPTAFLLSRLYSGGDDEKESAGDNRPPVAEQGQVEPGSEEPPDSIVPAPTPDAPSDGLTGDPTDPDAAAPRAALPVTEPVSETLNPEVTPSDLGLPALPVSSGGPTGGGEPVADALSDN